jgi:uncharacterized membrane protein YoaK (UPF0700 family)
MNLIVVLCCLFIIVKSISCLNKMHKYSHNGIYIYHVIFSMGALTLTLAILNGHNVTSSEILLTIGIVTRYTFNRRQRTYELDTR